MRGHVSLRALRTEKTARKRVVSRRRESLIERRVIFFRMKRAPEELT